MLSFFKFISVHLFIRVLLVLSLSSFSFMVSSASNNGSDEAASGSLKVVTTFSILADMVSQIGGDRVRVHALVDWDEDAHVFQPSPDDVKHIADANLLILNGLGFEGWLARLLSAAEYKGKSVEVTQNVDLITLDVAESDHDDHHDEHSQHHGHEHSNDIFDPHAWHSLKAAQVYLFNIKQALISIDPNNTDYYEKRLKDYSSKLIALDKSISTRVADIEKDKRRLVVPHNAFAYLARDYDFHIHSLQGLSTDSETSAADLAKIVRLIRSLNINAIFTETTSDIRLIRVVESETDATIEGALVSGALSRTLAPTYLEMMEYNSRLIIDALSKNK